MTGVAADQPVKILRGPKARALVGDVLDGSHPVTHLELRKQR